MAAQRIWQRYSEQLLRFAYRKLSGMPRRSADEEDVVLSAFNSFCQAAAAGRFRNLEDRNDLWQVLATLTARKAIAQIRRERCKKRGDAAVRGESVFTAGNPNDAVRGIDLVVDRSGSPDLAVAACEQCERLINLLDDENLRSVVLCKLEGLTNEEIAAKLKCATTTVERKLARIRKRWEQEIEK